MQVLKMSNGFFHETSKYKILLNSYNGIIHNLKKKNNINFSMVLLCYIFEFVNFSN